MVERLSRVRDDDRDVTTGAAVITLLPGGKPDDDLVVAKLRVILKAAEAGEFDDFFFVGMKKGADEARLVWPMRASFRLIGAVAKSLKLIMG